MFVCSFARLFFVFVCVHSVRAVFLSVCLFVCVCLCVMKDRTLKMLKRHWFYHQNQQKSVTFDGEPAAKMKKLKKC